MRHYDVSTGLPTNEVYELVQDKKGFLWIGCDAGLVRYDGHDFKLFTNAMNRGPAISGLSEDKYGNIWCSNFSGQVFYSDGDSLYLFEPWEKRYRKAYADVTFDGQNSIYISNFENKLYKYNIDTKEESVVVNDLSTKKKVFTMYDGSILYTLLDSGMVKQLSFPGNNTIFRIDANGRPVTTPILENFVFYNSCNKSQTLCFQRFNPGNRVPCLYYYANKALYVHPATPVLQQLNAYPLCCFDDDNGNLMVGTYNELLWLKKETGGKWVLYNRMLTGNGVSYITKDREGSFWVSTLKNGIFKIPNLDIRTFSPQLVGLKSSGVNHLASDGRELLFATAISGEVFGMEINTGKVFSVPTAETRDAQALEYNPYANELFVSKVGTTIYNPLTRHTERIDYSINNAKDFFFTSDGAVFSTGGSLYESFKTGNEKLKARLFNLFDTIQPVYISYFSNDPGWSYFILAEQRNKGVWFDESTATLWAGFVDGTVYFENKRPVKLVDPGTRQPVVATSFAQAANGDMLMGTVEQGIYVVRNKQIIQRYTTGNGLLSNKIKRLHYSNGTLWVIDGGAVQGLDITTGKIKTIDIHDGLLSPEIFDVEVMNHRVYVATSAGINFFPETIEVNNRQPPASYILSLFADEKKYTPDDRVHLLPGTKNITIELQGIALKSDGAFVYQYRLLPADTTWITVGAGENKIRFSSLSPGTYTFQSRVFNEDGIVSREKSELRFTIARHWWQQRWFLLTCISLIGAVIYLLFRARIKASRKKADEEIAKARVQEELRQSQLASLKAQMNPHFMFNALNSIQEFILLNDKRQANMYMGKFADLMRMTLDMSNKKEVALEDEIKTLSLYLELEALRFEEHFIYHIHISSNINPAEVQLPSMLIQPYVENAIKHGLLHKQGEKKLAIEFSAPAGNILSCIITDNGIGRKRSMEINSLRQKKYTSFATGATQKRLELLNQERKAGISVQYEDMTDVYGNATGTRVELNIPF